MFCIFHENGDDKTEMFQLQLSRAYTISRPCFSHPAPANRLEMHSNLGWDTSGTPADQKEVPGHMISCSVIKLREEAEREDISVLWNLFSRVTVMHDGDLLF